ncbi:MAG: hypothetical protein ACPL6D_11110 [Thermodesulfobacteriota bacterium]
MKKVVGFMPGCAEELFSFHCNYDRRDQNRREKGDRVFHPAIH